MTRLNVAVFEGEPGTTFNNQKRGKPFFVIKPFATATLLFLVLGGTSARAQEACVVCAGPDAIYRCTVEKSDKLARFGGAGDKALQHVCAKEMARQGKHEKCSVRRDTVGAACDGQPRMITIANLLEAAPEPAPAPVTPVPASAPPAAKPAEAKPQPPRTLQELAERTGETSKQQIKDGGDTFGDSAKRTWKCITTLFQKC